MILIGSLWISNSGSPGCLLVTGPTHEANARDLWFVRWIVWKWKITPLSWLDHFLVRIGLTVSVLEPIILVTTIQAETHPLEEISWESCGGTSTLISFLISNQLWDWISFHYPQWSSLSRTRLWNVTALIWLYVSSVSSSTISSWIGLMVWCQKHCATLVSISTARYVLVWSIYRLFLNSFSSVLWGFVGCYPVPHVI